MAANSRFAVALHIAAVLASKRGEYVPSTYVASSVNTNSALIRRILRDLTKGGLVESEKGKSGGSRLARAADRISLWDVYRALGEAPLFAVHRNPANMKCPISRRMKKALGGVFDGAAGAAARELKRTTLRELVELRLES